MKLVTQLQPVERPKQRLCSRYPRVQTFRSCQLTRRDDKFGRTDPVAGEL